MGKHIIKKNTYYKTDVEGHMAFCKGAILLPSGCMALKKGFTWDGADVVRDNKINLMPSAVHDALYQMITNGSLPKKERVNADKTYTRMCRKNGQGWLMNKASYYALRLFGRFHI